MTEKPPRPEIPLREGINFRAKTCDHLSCHGGHPLPPLPRSPTCPQQFVLFSKRGKHWPGKQGLRVSQRNAGCDEDAVKASSCDGARPQLGRTASTEHRQGRGREGAKLTTGSRRGGRQVSLSLPCRPPAPPAGLSPPLRCSPSCQGPCLPFADHTLQPLGQGVYLA